jgi:hypothetical protein
MVALTNYLLGFVDIGLEDTVSFTQKLKQLPATFRIN